MTTVPRRLKLDRVQVIHAAKLIHMEYSPSELAAELACEVETVYRNLIPLGLPHRRDGKHIWIVGDDAREWIRAMAGGSRTGLGRMPDGMAHCCHCHRRVPMTVIDVVPWGHAERVRGTCDVCGCAVNVARRRAEAVPNA